MKGIPVLVTITGLIYLLGGIVAIAANSSYFAAFPVYQMMNGGNGSLEIVIPLQVMSGAATAPARVVYAAISYADPYLLGSGGNLILSMFGLSILFGIIALAVGYWLFRGKKIARPLAYAYLLLDIAGLIFLAVQDGASAVNLYNILYLGLSLLLYVVMFAFIRAKKSQEYFNTAPA